MTLHSCANAMRWGIIVPSSGGDFFKGSGGYEVPPRTAAMLTEFKFCL